VSKALAPQHQSILDVEMTRVNSRLGSPTGTLIFLLALFLLTACSAASVSAQMPEATPSTTRALTLDDAIRAAEANNRAIRVAQLEREKALDQVQIARTYRLPEFSLIALGSQSLSRLGLTLEKGSLGVYPNVGPIPGKTTTLESPLRVGGIFYASVAQPLSQQYKIGLGIQMARVGVEAADEQIRSKQQSTVNEVRRLYYGILQSESGKKSLQATVDFLKRLDRDTDQNVAQRVALKADSLNVKAQLAQAEYELLKLDDPLQTQKQQLNRLMGRDPDTPFDVDPSTAVVFELPQLQEARARAIESRPEIRLARLQVRKAELDRRIKNAERIPDVSFSLTTLATANLSNALPRNLSVVGIQVNWDVFDWGRKREQLKEKRHAEEQALLELKDAEALVIVDVSHQYRRLIEARKELEVARLSQSAATELLRVTRNQFTQRYALLSDVLKVQSSLAEADHRFIQALLNLAATQADFKKAMGEDQ
jgi:outer membrane protein TolC